jgi:hypothetical protein
MALGPVLIFCYSTGGQHELQKTSTALQHDCNCKQQMAEKLNVPGANNEDATSREADNSITEEGSNCKPI